MVSLTIVNFSSFWGGFGGDVRHALWLTLRVAVYRADVRTEPETGFSEGEAWSPAGEMPETAADLGL